MSNADIETVFEESNANDELPTPRSPLDDIKAFEEIMKKPMSYEEQGILAIKYRVRVVSNSFFTNTNSYL